MAISLSSIRRSGRPKPPMVIMYAVHGIGKTTFGASAPRPIFIQTEDGLGKIETDTFGVLKTFDIPAWLQGSRRYVEDPAGRSDSLARRTRHGGRHARAFGNKAL